MNDHQSAIRRARHALESAADLADDEHPGIDVLEAYIDRRLGPEERAEVERLAAALPIVAEDLADLRAVHDQRHEPIPATRAFRRGRLAAAAGIAATLVMGAWLTNRPGPPDVEPLALAQLSGDERTRVDAALAAGRMTIPDAVARLKGAQGTLLGDAPSGAALAPVSPAGTFVREARPAFSWTDAGADAYTVAVFDEGFTEVARSPRVNGTTWTPEIDLTRGASYVWQITAHRAGGDETAPRPPNPEARFAVLDAAQAARMADLETRAARDPLAYGILLAEAGLLVEAREQLRNAAAAPETAEVAGRLRQSLP